MPGNRLPRIGRTIPASSPAGTAPPAAPGWGSIAHGVVAAVLNRQGSLGPAAGKRSRGELPLIALAEPTVAAAVQAIATLDAGRWRSFNLVLADAAGAVFVRGLGHGRPQLQPLAPGLPMVTAHDPDDLDSPRVARHLPRFAAAPPPDPVRGWQAWQDLLADQTGEAAEQLNVVPARRLRHGLLLAARPAGARITGLAVRRRPAARCPVHPGRSDL